MSIPAAAFDRSLRAFLAPIAPLLGSGDVSEIMINGHEEIYVEERGRLRRTDVKFESEQDLMAALRNLAQYVGREVGPDHPILEARLPDGSRVEAIVPPVAVDGPIVSIRRLSPMQVEIDRLVDGGSISQLASDVLELFVLSKQNIVVAGEAGSGKTSLLAALSGFASPTERVVVIEDSPELQLPLPHVVRLQSRSTDGGAHDEVSVRTLLRATLRVRPDRIVLGEIRGAEAIDLVQAMMSGHRGCLSTVHATYPIDALNRLENLSLATNLGLPSAVLRDQIASAVDIIVQTSRAGAFRCVTHITEVLGYDPNTGYELADLFVRDFTCDGRRVAEESVLLATGRTPRCEAAVRAAGLQLPIALQSEGPQL